MIRGFSRIAGISNEHNEQHRKLFAFSFPILEKVVTTAPTVTTLQPGYAQIYDDGTDKHIYFNINNTLYYWTLTAA